MTYIRTPEHRAQHAQRIHQWQPWKQSTGPKTPEGKSKVSKNAYKGDLRGRLRNIASALRAHRQLLDEFVL